MKKLLVLSLAIVMMFAMATTSFAAITAADGSETADVTAKYKAGATDGEIVYSVNVTFDNMTFTYTGKGASKWDPESHSYPEVAAEGWDKTEANIKVTNHSNASVAVTVSYTESANAGDVDGAISNGTFTLATAVETTVENAPTNTAKLTISGTPAESATAGVVVGTVTVAIAAVQ